MAKSTRNPEWVTTVKMPLALQKRVEHLRRVLPSGLDLNVSAICREAVEARVAKLEEEHGVR